MILFDNSREFTITIEIIDVDHASACVADEVQVVAVNALLVLAHQLLDIVDAWLYWYVYISGRGRMCCGTGLSISHRCTR
jgi:hypothetical protein